MKYKIAIILVLILTLSASVLAESLVPLELGMPFGVIRSTGSKTSEVYDNEEITNKKRIDQLPDGYIVQILAVYGEYGSCRVYYFDDQNKHHVGYIPTSSVQQLTIAGLIGIMEDPKKATYLQQFIGESLPYVKGNLASVSGTNNILAAAVLPGLTDETETKSAKQPAYILNLNTKRFHLPSCKSINDINSKNFEPFDGTRQEAIDKGFKPCGNCNP